MRAAESEFISSLRLPHDSRGVAVYDSAFGHVTCHHSPRAHNCSGADSQSGKDNGAHSHERAPTDFDATGNTRSRRHVNTVGKLAFMVHAGVGIYDAGAPDVSVGANRRVGENLASLGDPGSTGHERSRMHQRRGCYAIDAQEIEKFEPIHTARPADSHDPPHRLFRIRSPPLEKSLRAVMDGNVWDRRASRG